MRFLLFAVSIGIARACYEGAVVEGRPHVQCDRTPPCMRWSWLTPERCRARPRIEDWHPYVDPDLARNEEHWVSIRHLFRTHFQNKRVWLVADSIGNLVYSGLMCEVSRHKMHYSTHGRMMDEFRSQKYAATWYPDPPYSADYFEDTNTTIMIQKGWHVYNRTDFTSILSLADVVLVNYALHYHDMDVYEESMKEMFQLLKDWSGQAFFRETGPQFYALTGSYASHEQAHPKNGDTSYNCEAMPADVVWNNQIYRQNEIIRRLAPEKVKIVPFYNLTLNRWKQLEGRYCQAEGRASGQMDSTCLDCTVRFYHTDAMSRFLTLPSYLAPAGPIGLLSIFAIAQLCGRSLSMFGSAVFDFEHVLIALRRLCKRNECARIWEAL